MCLLRLCYRLQRLALRPMKKGRPLPIEASFQYENGLCVFPCFVLGRRSHIVAAMVATAMQMR
jgi:hypothetical protein